jgi:hypothetical protein
MRMNVSVHSNAIAGVIAAVIWIIIAAVTGGGAGFVIVGGVVLGLVVFAVSFLIARVIIASKASRT